MAVVRADGFQYLPVSTPPRPPSRRRPSAGASTPTTRASHSHYMRKEIFEQPEALRRTLSGRLDRRSATAHLGGVDLEPARRPAHPAGEAPGLRLGVLCRAGRRQPHRAASRGSRRAPSRHRSSGTATRSSSRKPSTLRSASRARPSTPCAPSRRSAARAGASSGSSTWSGAVSPASAGAGIPPRRARDRRRLHQGVQLHRGRALALLALHLGRVRDLGLADGERIIAGLDALPGKIARDPRVPRTTSPRWRERFVDGVERHLRGSGRRLSRRARGCPEAERDHLHPRRGIPLLGAQAWTTGPDRARAPVGRDRPGRRPVREEPLDDRRDPVAAGTGDRRRAHRGAGASRRRGPPGPEVRAGARPAAAWASPSSCWPTTSPWRAASTSTNPGTSPRASPSSRRPGPPTTPDGPWPTRRPTRVDRHAPGRRGRWH